MGFGNREFTAIAAAKIGVNIVFKHSRGHNA